MSLLAKHVSIEARPLRDETSRSFLLLILERENI